MGLDIVQLPLKGWYGNSAVIAADMEGQLASEYAYSKGVHYSVFR